MSCYAPKGQKHVAQGNALGIRLSHYHYALKGQKNYIIIFYGFSPYRAPILYVQQTQGDALGYVLDAPSGRASHRSFALSSFGFVIRT